MTGYILKRLVLMVPVLFAVTLIIFLLMKLVPGDAAEAMLGPYATPENVERLREEMHLNESIVVQYTSWIGGLVQGDMGTAYSIDRPVRDEVLERFGATLILAGAAFVICCVLGLGVGFFLALKERGMASSVVTLLTMAGISLPSFWLGLLLILLFAVTLHWLPAGGMYSLFGGESLGDLLRHLILPAFSLGVVAAAVTARLMRTQMLEVLRAGYVRTARAKGLSEVSALGKHAFVNGFIAVIPVLGLQAGYVLGGAVYIETIFQWPGIGRMLVQAIQSRDLLLVQGGVLVVGVSYLFINFLADLLQHALDPRLKQ